MRVAARDVGCNASDIRAALVERLIALAGDGPALVLHELPVGSGELDYVVGGVRSDTRPVTGAFTIERLTSNVDVALVTPEALDLYEIKGAGDSLARLRRQAPAYDETGTRNTLVIDERHAKRAPSAVGAHWRILVATGSPVTFTELQPGSPNPHRSFRGSTGPLYPRELRALAVAYGANRTVTRFTATKYVASCAALDTEALAQYLRRCLALRDHESVYDPYGGSLAERKKQQPTIIGSLATWPITVADMAPLLGTHA